MAKLGTAPLGKLHSTIDKGFPRHRNKFGGLDVRKIASEMHLTREAVYLWFRKESISPEVANKLVALSNGRLSLEKLSEFVFTDK
jgi:hypothetical protein